MFSPASFCENFVYAGIFLFILPWTACFRSLTCCTPACFASESSLLRFAGLVLLASSLRVATSFLAFGFRGRFSFAQTFSLGPSFRRASHSFAHTFSVGSAFRQFFSFSSIFFIRSAGWTLLILSLHQTKKEKKGPEVERRGEKGRNERRGEGREERLLPEAGRTRTGARGSPQTGQNAQTRGEKRRGED